MSSGDSLLLMILLGLVTTVSPVFGQVSASPAAADIFSSNPRTTAAPCQQAYERPRNRRDSTGLALDPQADRDAIACKGNPSCLEQVRQRLMAGEREVDKERSDAQAAKTLCQTARTKMHAKIQMLKPAPPMGRVEADCRPCPFHAQYRKCVSEAYDELIKQTYNQSNHHTFVCRISYTIESQNGVKSIDENSINVSEETRRTCSDEVKDIIMNKLSEKVVDWYALRLPKEVNSINRVDVFSYPLEERNKPLAHRKDPLSDDICKTNWEAYSCPGSDASP